MPSRSSNVPARRHLPAIFAATLAGFVLGCVATVSSPSGPVAFGSTPFECTAWEVKVEHMGSGGQDAGTYSGGWEPFATQVSVFSGNYDLTLRRCTD